MEGVTIVQKGKTDYISDGNKGTVLLHNPKLSCPEHWESKGDTRFMMLVIVRELAIQYKSLETCFWSGSTQKHINVEFLCCSVKLRLLWLSPAMWWSR